MKACNAGSNAAGLWGGNYCLGCMYCRLEAQRLGGCQQQYSSQRCPRSSSMVNTPKQQHSPENQQATQNSNAPSEVATKGPRMNRTQALAVRWQSEGTAGVRSGSNALFVIQRRITPLVHAINGQAETEVTSNGFVYTRCVISCCHFHSEGGLAKRCYLCNFSRCCSAAQAATSRIQRADAQHASRSSTRAICC